MCTLVVVFCHIREGNSGTVFYGDSNRKYSRKSAGGFVGYAFKGKAVVLAADYNTNLITVLPGEGS